MSPSRRRSGLGDGRRITRLSPVVRAQSGDPLAPEPADVAARRAAKALSILALRPRRGPRVLEARLQRSARWRGCTAASSPRCVINLVRNAAQASDAATRSPVGLTERAVTRRVRRSPTEGGAGMTPDVLRAPRSCQPFFTTRGDRGTGLGVGHLPAHRRASTAARSASSRTPGEGTRAIVSPAHAFGAWPWSAAGRAPCRRRVRASWQRRLPTRWSWSSTTSRTSRAWCRRSSAPGWRVRGGRLGAEDALAPHGGRAPATSCPVAMWPCPTLGGIELGPPRRRRRSDPDTPVRDVHGPGRRWRPRCEAHARGRLRLPAQDARRRRAARGASSAPPQHGNAGARGAPAARTRSTARRRRRRSSASRRR